MAPPLLSLQGAHLTFGGTPLFRDVDVAVGTGDRLCLVGRNGSGKSTLLKVLAGELALDSGERFAQPGCKIGVLPQTPDFCDDETVAGYVARDDVEPHAALAVIEKLRLAPDARTTTLSGGEGRRATLARALAIEPDILLLDEPTNHLDLPTIEWLEDYLSRFRGGLLIISHDRAFLSAVTNGCLWLDRYEVKRHVRGYADFETWSEQVYAEQEAELNRVNQSIKAEQRYMHRGVTARRRRNQGRVRKLTQLRETRAQMLRRDRSLNLDADTGQRSGRIVVDADGISKSYDGNTIVDNFTTRITRGDRVGLIGPNGAGKTTLLNMLIGKLEPDSGTIIHGANVTLSQFDQQRAALDPDKTLWETLSPGGGDSILVRGQQKHVVAYMKDFLFDERQARSPVRMLSGGERNRLLLARNLAQASNLLALDEPTNDLDLETLDLLEEMLGDYEGTLLLVSHDRDFLDRLVNSVIVVEGGGHIEEYAGGYTDYLHHRRTRQPAAYVKERPKTAAAERTASRSKARLSYKETRDLELLPQEIEKLSTEIAALETALADPALFEKDPDGFQKRADRLTAAQTERETAEEAWLELEMKREELAQA